MGLAVKAHGFSVAFYRLEDLLHEMRKDAGVAPQRLRRKKYFNVTYLVVDEVGFEPISHQDTNLFFRLVSYRYLRGSTAITTSKSVKDWPGIFAGDEAMTAAASACRNTITRSRGAYFVTGCMQDRACLFGEVVGGQMRRNDAGADGSIGLGRNPDVLLRGDNRWIRGHAQSRARYHHPRRSGPLWPR